MQNFHPKISTNYTVGLQSFNSYEEAQSYILKLEQEIKRAEQSFKNFSSMALSEKNNLIRNIEEAYENAFNKNHIGVIYTAGNCEYIALSYMKNICLAFVEKHKDIKMV